MDQGGSDDRPNRGSDHDRAQRKADDERSDEAEQSVQEVLDDVHAARENTRELHSTRIIRDQALSDPPGRMVMPIKQEETSPKRVTAGQIEYNTNNLEFVENSEVRNSFYYGLRDAEFDDAVSQIASACDTENVPTATDNTVERMCNWKRGSGDRAAQTHEAAFKQALGIDAEVRDVADGPDEISDEEIDAAHELHELTASFLREHMDGEFETYRGLGYYLADTARELFDNPENNEYTLEEVSVLSNYTLDNQLAAKYSKVAVKKTTTPDDIAVSSDLLVRNRDSDDNLITEAEVRMRGDRISNLASNRLVVAETGQELSEIVNSIPDTDQVIEQVKNTRAISGGERDRVLSIKQHKAIRRCVERMATQDGSGETDEPVRIRTVEAKNILENWLLLYQAETDGENWRQLRNKISDIVQDVE